MERDSRANPVDMYEDLQINRASMIPREVLRNPSVVGGISPCIDIAPAYHA